MKFIFCKVTLLISLSLTVTSLGGSSLQTSMSVLPRCTIATPTPCALTCPAPTAATVSRDMSVWMTSPAQVSSQLQQQHSYALCFVCIPYLLTSPKCHTPAGPLPA